MDRLRLKDGRAQRRRSAWAAAVTLLAAATAALGLAHGAQAAGSRRAAADAQHIDSVWAASWAAAPEAQRAPNLPLSNQTVRQMARLTLGGLYVRVQLSNEFGDKPLVVGAAHIALAAGAGSAIRPETDHAVTFGGRPGITIPPGARVLSDPVGLKVEPFSNVAVSVYLPETTGAVTEHYFANQSVYVGSRDQTGAADMPGATAATNEMIITGVQVSVPAKSRVVVTLGDSITGGFGSTLDANHTWPDRLAERLAERKNAPQLGVVNAAIGGNRLLHDFIGPNALSRFDRDVLAQPNVGYLIVLIGINDFGLPGGRNLPAEEVSYQDVIAGYQQLIERAHSYGIKVFIATLPPFGPIPERPGYYSEASEAKRVAVNQWIRGGKGFEGVIDFEAALRDPKAINRMLPAYDSGDHLNPNDAGYKAMADAIEMRLFE
jgi:lysophospholipase L1-like esterase